LKTVPVTIIRVMDPTYAAFGPQRPGRNTTGPPISKPEPEPGACLMSGSMKFDQDVINFVLEDVRLSTLQKKLAKETNSVKQMALALQVSYFLPLRSSDCKISYPIHSLVKFLD